MSKSQMVPITAVIIAQNEQANIRYCMRSVKSWASEIYIVDSFSTDNTAKIAEEEGELLPSTSSLIGRHSVIGPSTICR